MDEDNNKNVEVSFELVGPNTVKFTFEPDEVTMKKKGKVIFHRHPRNAEWKFKGGIVKNDELNQFCSSVHGNGKNLHIDDELKDKGDPVRYEYQIMVQQGKTIYESPDPVIVNDPGDRIQGD